MKPFQYKDLESLAVTLPDMVDFYRRSGDFDGELACIEQLLKRGGLPRSMQTRLELEQVIARGMREDYLMDRAAFLARLQQKYPKCDDALVDLLLASGHIDTILRGGELRFQRAAVSNALISAAWSNNKIEPSTYGKGTAYYSSATNRTTTGTYPTYSNGTWNLSKSLRAGWTYYYCIIYGD